MTHTYMIYHVILNDADNLIGIRVYNRKKLPDMQP